MLRSSRIRIPFVLLVLFVLTACGGGGGGGGGNSGSPYPEIAVNSNATNDNVALSESKFFYFDAVAGTQYTIRLSTSSGDTDLALFNNQPFDLNSLIDFSVNDGLDDDVINFVASASQSFYLEVFGFAASNFSIEVNESLPVVANAGNDQVVGHNVAVSLNGSLSYSTNNRPLQYQWTQVSGPAVVLTNADSVSPSFTTPASDVVLRFSLVVTDGSVQSLSDEVIITVQNSAPVITNINVTPDPALTTSILTAQISAVDNDNQALIYDYSWSLNGNPIAGQNASTLDLSAYAAGDVITFTGTVSDGLATVSQTTNNIVIQAAPPSVTNTAITATYGQPLSYQISATDPQNLTITYTMLYGPTGMSVDSSGLVAWIPHRPIFSDQENFNFGVRLTTSQSTVDATFTVTVSDAARQYPLVRSGIEVPYKAKGMIVGDFDNNGSNELLLSNNSKLLYTMKYNGSNYVQDWFYPFDLAEGHIINSIYAHDLDADNAEEFIVGTYVVSGNAGDAKVFVIDGASKKVINELQVDMKIIHSIEVVDVDNDFQLELVLLVGDSLNYGEYEKIQVYDVSSMLLERETPAIDLGASLAFGNVDSDPAIEMITNNGYVFDGISLANEWSYGPGFGSSVDTGDLDGDGIDEIVGAIDWTAVRGFSAILKSPLWEVQKSDLDSLYVGNIDADPQAEIIVGDGQWGNVVAYSYDSTGNTLIQDWSINSQDHGAAALTAGDIDNDGKLEVIWSTGLSHSGEDSLVIAGLNPDIGVEWQNQNPSQLDGDFAGGQWLNLQAGDNRVVYATPRTDSGYAGARLVAIDPASGDVSLSSEVGTNWSGQFALAGSDYDLDGVDEIFLATSSFYDGYFTAYDFISDLSEWTSQTGLGTGIAVTHGDMTGDNHNEMVVLASQGFASQSYAYVYDVFSQTLVWKSTGLDRGIDIKVADLDNDNIHEIVIATAGTIYIYEKNNTFGYSLRDQVSISNVSSLEVGDTDNNGTPEIIVTTIASSYPLPTTDVVLMDSALNELSRVSVSGTITDVILENRVSANRKLLVAVFNQSVYNDPLTTLKLIDFSSGGLIWSSPSLIGVVTANSIHYADTNADGIDELNIGTSDVMYLTR